MIHLRMLLSPEPAPPVNKGDPLKEIASQKEIMLREGRLTVDKLLEAKREVAKVELELCESEKERVKVHEVLVALAQDLAPERLLKKNKRL